MSRFHPYGKKDYEAGEKGNGRNWVFTINTATESDIDRLTKVECKFVMYGVEKAPDTGTPHLQGFILFRERKRFSGVKKLFPRAYLSPMKGSFEQNEAYCSKEDLSPYIRGLAPKSKTEIGDAEKNRWQQARESAETGELESIPSDIYIRYYRTLKEIKKDHMVVPDDLDGGVTTGHWFYGPAGAGKSRKARDLYPQAYLKMCNKWWDGYQGQEHVLIDDFDKNHAVLAHHLKIWADKYAFLGENKGGAVAIRPKSIVITSQYSIDEIWEDEETRQAMRRRFKVTKFPDPSSPYSMY